MLSPHLHLDNLFPAPDTLATALRYLAGDLSLIPVRRDGSKAPACDTWLPYQHEPPTEAQVREWFSGAYPPGIAIVNGEVSGNLETLDFDNRAEEIFPAWCRLVESEAPGLVDRLSIAKTPRGYHARYRVPDLPQIPGNTRLAVDPAAPASEQTLIETRGQGGYALAPGSPIEVHETGRPYVHFGGPPLDRVPAIGTSEREILIRAAKSFDRTPPPESPAPVLPMSPVPNNDHTDGPSPGDDFNDRGPDWGTILTPHGWVAVHQRGEATHWRRPNKNGPGWSATTGVCVSAAGRPLFYVFSSNAPPFEPRKGYSKFAAYTLLNYAGDFGAAAQALIAAGYAGGPSVPAGRLVLGANGSANGSVNGQAQTPPRIVRKKMSELRRLSDAEKWLWNGLIPAESVTILSALPKAGKTTLVAHLLRECESGGTFCGQPVRPCRVVVVTEENETIWAERRDNLVLADHIEVVLRPFRTKPTFKQWITFLEELAESLRAEPADLVVIDTLAKLWPVQNENDASEITAALMPLLEIAYQHHATLLLIHHLRKSDGLEATATRGSGALTAAVDAILELRRFNPGDRTDHRRVITCDSRFGDRLDELVVELGIGGYLAHGDKDDAAAEDLIKTILKTLPDQPPGLSADEIHGAWPEDKSPRRNRLRSALRQGTDAGRWRREGKGTKGDPFTYWRPSQSEKPENAVPPP
jgi:hypothetical protein